jgi:hypothetical protein
MTLQAYPIFFVPYRDYAHLISWLIVVFCFVLHLLMSIKVSGIPLILSMLNWRFRSQDSPALWRTNFTNWRKNLTFTRVKQWLLSFSLLRFLEIFILTIIVLAWVISIIKEVS